MQQMCMQLAFLQNAETLSLQTAASQPHGGVALYRDILANVLDVEDDSVSGGKVSESSSNVQESGEKMPRGLRNLSQYTEPFGNRFRG